MQTTLGFSEVLGALRAAGPDAGCWTWWDRAESPRTSGAVARHQLQEVAVHTYDAQLAAGAPQPLPGRIAVDGVDEFLQTSCAGAYRWPYGPATLDYVAEGHSWRLELGADGVRLVRSPPVLPAPRCGRPPGSSCWRSTAGSRWTR
ncbi:maleylpyruvate isomerase N-terminal domain-containing protein [Paractinoplanes durhamensis]|uniref:maleylpyruvate isomerase N-terminal domain-containing protein n=1 Tax=Paractinoplanes durhamensis TaxID=113563 RepID=UPI00363507DF